MNRLTPKVLLSIGLAMGQSLLAAETQPTSPNDPEHAARMAKGLRVFKDQVRTVLVGRCVKCHGGEQTESDLDLTTRQGLLRGGAEGAAIDLDNSQASRLLKLVRHSQEPYMPEDGAKLDARAIDALSRWIELGAPYDKPLINQDDDPQAWTRRKIDDSARQFWSFKPIAQVRPPQLPDDSWSHTDLDRFVVRRLREHKLAPNDPATRRTLVRRAFFDLIGLPPAPEEVERFVNDPDPQAYERLVDKLLRSPHYGERWGRHWLDVARFAESHGFEQDYDRPHAYHFRDFVIKALNADMPYDRFVRWQLAGDEIAPENPLAMMATGFLGAGVFPTQLTEKEFESARYDELDDMVATMGTAMLGVTVGCARCHDHKFDPIPQADYYRLISSFTTTIRSHVEIDLDPDGYKRAKASFDREHAPLVAARADYERGQLASQFEQWLRKPTIEDAPRAKWTTLDLVSFKSPLGSKLAKLDDGSVLVSGKNPQHDRYEFVTNTRLRSISAVRLDALTHSSLPKNGPGRAQNGNFCLSEFVVKVAPLDNPKATPQTVRMTDARATHQQNKTNLSVRSSIDDGRVSGWAVDKGGIGKNQSAVFDLEQPIDFASGVRIIFEMKFNNNVQHSLGRLRLSVTSQPTPVPIEGDQIGQLAAEARALLETEKRSDQLSDAQRSALQHWFVRQDKKWQKLNRAVEQHSRSAPKPDIQKVLVSSEGLKPIKHHADGRGYPHFYQQTHFLNRGDVGQKQGVATQRFLQVLMRDPDGASQWQVDRPKAATTSYQRRALANWITDTEYGAGHLLARVIVNRLLHHHFGRGIVATPNDFGFQGERPTHPELLDWLATRLIQGGWRLKPLHKLIMTSAVYMQSSEHDAADAKIDPQNHWGWRFTPRRLEAEVIRDAMLTVSGQLDQRLFGPGTLDESMKRRSIYFMIKRGKLIPMMQLFDSPEPLVSVGERPSTTIAPQALMFMNNPQVRGYARSFAQRIDAVAGQSIEEAVRRSYLIAVARPPSEKELVDSTKFVEQQIESYRADHKSDERELALADLCQVLMSLNEFVYVQ